MLMKICTPAQMQQIDRRAIDGLGIPGLDLMESAGRSTYEMIVEYYGAVANNRVMVVAGKGNNGGDGCVIARYLKENGAHVEIFLLSIKKDLKGDAEVNFKRAVEAGISVREVQDPADLLIPDDTWLIVDAIFGTGLSGEMRSPYAAIINKINETGIPVVAVDAPSGLNGATGEVASPTVKADLTVTFGLPKIGQVLYPGKSYCGFLEIVDIGFPEGLDEDIKTHLITRADARALMPPRKPDAHKGDYGKLFVLAGSTGLTGAATMSSLTALKAGAGLVILGCPTSLNPILEIKLTEVMTKPLPDVKKRGCFALRGMGEIRQQVKWADAVALGPGIGTHHETAELIQRLTRQIEKPMVIDADGLNNLARHIESLKQHKAPLVISPHPGEFSRLSGEAMENIAKNRMALAGQFAAEFNLTIILKGAPSLIAEPGGNIYINYSGNEGMATAGSGDVLTGLIGSFLAQGVQATQAAILATYVHGLAGDIAAEAIGSRGMTAGDIMEFVPEALSDLEEPEEYSFEE